MSDKFSAHREELEENFRRWHARLESTYIEWVKNLQPPWDAPESHAQNFHDYVHEVLLDDHMEKDRIEAQNVVREFVQEIQKFNYKSAQHKRQCLHFVKNIKQEFMRKIDDWLNDVKDSVLEALGNAMNNEEQGEHQELEADDHTDQNLDTNHPPLTEHEWECEILSTEDEWFMCEDPDYKHILVKQLEQLEIEYAVNFKTYENASRNFVRHEVRKRTRQRVSKDMRQWQLPGKSINKRTSRPKRPSEKTTPQRYDVATDRLLCFHQFQKENDDLCRRDLFKKWNSMIRVKPSPKARWWGNQKVTLDWCLKRFVADYSREDIESWFNQLERVQ